MKCLFMICLVIASSSVTLVHSFGFGRPVRTLCVNVIVPPGTPPAQPGAPATINPGSQTTCVKCDANQFATTAQLCTGQPMVPQSTTSNQAWCLVNQCLRQIQQNVLLPSFGGGANQGGGQQFGRKRRAVEPSELADPEELEDAIVTEIKA